jgi:hypothetical protein
LRSKSILSERRIFRLPEFPEGYKIIQDLAGKSKAKQSNPRACNEAQESKNAQRNAGKNKAKRHIERESKQMQESTESTKEMKEHTDG